MWLSVPDVLLGATISLLIYWHFHNITGSRVDTELSHREKISSELQSRGGQCLIDVRGHRSEWLETIETQQ